MISKPFVQRITIFALRKIKSNDSEGKKKSYGDHVSKNVCTLQSGNLPGTLGTTPTVVTATQDENQMCVALQPSR